jgi:co-chaperonin GroES (HSP10)
MNLGIKALRDKVIVTNIESGARLTSKGIIIPDDDGKERGIRPRWAQVHSVGKNIVDIKPGDWVLISHGRWTRKFGDFEIDGKIKELRGAEYEGILLVSKTKPFS